MGVPAFYRWLSSRYPKIVVDCVEEEPDMVGTVEIPVDITLANPNGVEFHNLYLDMNGIIHPCFHPEDKPPPATESEVFSNIFEYIDRLVAIARPRALVYMAIDGVAPRAKMNQQRSRRFRAAQDREEQAKVEAELRADFAKQGIKLPDKDDTDTFDSNVITPGTPFMERLAMALQWYVHKRLNEEPGWRNLTVVLSDANTPGEGEHKFMQFIREQRGRPGWNPNTWHCVYGLDADLIHLALASHEPHFYILREVVFAPKPDRRRGPDGFDAAAAAAGMPGGVRGEQVKPDPKDDKKKPDVAKKPYQFLKINTLREYLQLEFKDLILPFQYDGERVIDDFIFMCFFVGNDFLPHMPTLDIREQGIELMLHVYREQLAQLGGYLSSGAHLHLDRIERFIEAVGGYEDKIFQARSRKLAADKRRHMSRKAEAQYQAQLNGNANGKLQSAPRVCGVGAERSGPSNGGMRGDSAPVIAQPNMTDPKKFLASADGSAPGAAVEGSNAPPVATGVTASKAEGATSNMDAAAALRERLKKRRRGSDEMEASDPAAADTSAAATASAPADGSAAETDGDAAAALWANAAAAAPANADADGATSVKTEGDMDADDPDDASPPTKCAKAEEATHATAAEDADYKARVKNILKDKSDLFEDMVEGQSDIRLGDEGWKARYYEQKFGIADEEAQQELIADLRRNYVEGLCWVMRYYFDGVASWRWFYRYHYAPFASDLAGMGSLQIDFELGEPFEPFNQLMGVFPAGSKHALPAPLQPLFDSEDSPILDFYPKDFKVDMNGKRFAWQGVALLPFIDEDRLLEATAPVIAQLPPAERRRNERRKAVVYAHSSSATGSKILEQATEAKKQQQQQQESETQLAALPAAHTQVSGQIAPCLGDACPPEFPVPPFASSIGVAVAPNGVAAALFKDPPHQAHLTQILPGTVLDPQGLSALDLPRHETPWCLQHDERMAQRGVHPPGERVDYRYAQVGQAGHRMVAHHLPRNAQGMIPGGSHQQWLQGGAQHPNGHSQYPAQPPHHMQQHQPQYGGQRGYGGPPMMGGASQQMHMMAPQMPPQQQQHAVYYDHTGALIAAPPPQQQQQQQQQQPQVMFHNGVMYAAAPMAMPMQQVPQQQAPGHAGSFFAAMQPQQAQMGPAGPQQGFVGMPQYGQGGMQAALPSGQGHGGWPQQQNSFQVLQDPRYR